MTTRRILLLAILTYFILATSLFLIIPQLARAQDGSNDDSCKIGTSKEEKKAAIRVAIPLPGVTQKIVITKELEPGQYGPEAPVEEYWAVKNLSCYLSGFYRYFAGVAGILATVMIMYGGVQYVISFGNPGRLQTAKDTIFSAMVGLVITLGSYIILYTINPNLVTLKLPEVGSIATILQGTNWCDSAKNPTPVVSGATQCGNIGLYDDKKTECVYDTCPNEGDICIRGEPGDPYVLDKFYCGNARQVCNNTDANFLSSGEDERIKGLCSYYSHDDPANPENSGKCQWVGRPGGPTGCLTRDESCHFFQELICPDGWERAGCQECMDNYEQGFSDLFDIAYCSGSFSIVRGGFLQCDINEIGDRSVYSGYAFCSSDQDGSPVYQLDVGPSVIANGQTLTDTYSSICCKRGVEYKEVCEMEYTLTF
jgi:hypothetical protein